jgi:uncharacterized membrane protein (Fun14 family)
VESLSIVYWYEVLKSKLAGYPVFLPDIIIGFPIGLVVGFLLKTLGRYLFIGILLTAGLLWLADYFNLITIHQGEVEAMLGMQPFHSFNEFFSFISQVAKEHVAGVVSLIVGFLLGWRLGL